MVASKLRRRGATCDQNPARGVVLLTFAIRFMGKHLKTRQRILDGAHDASIRFDDVRGLLLALGFAERIRGSHHIFSREGVDEILNLQPRGAMAKPYQVKQVRNVIVRYHLGDPQ